MKVNNCQSQNYRKQNPVFKSRVEISEVTREAMRSAIAVSRRVKKDSDVVTSIMGQVDAFAKALETATTDIGGTIVIARTMARDRRAHRFNIAYRGAQGTFIHPDIFSPHPVQTFLPKKGSYKEGIETVVTQVLSLVMNKKSPEFQEGKPFARVLRKLLRSD